LAGIGEPSAGDEDGCDADGEVGQGITEKVIARMRIIEAGRTGYDRGAREIGGASASVYGERLGALMHVQFGSNRSIL